MAEWVIDGHHVLPRCSLCAETGPQGSVGCARVDLVRTQQEPSANFPAFLAHQVSDPGDRLLVGSSSCVEDVSGTFLALILDRIVKQTIQLLEHRQDRLAGGRCPAAEYNRDPLV